jgi:hypothetical protein
VLPSIRKDRGAVKALPYRDALTRPDQVGTSSPRGRGLKNNAVGTQGAVTQ